MADSYTLCKGQDIAEVALVKFTIEVFTRGVLTLFYLYMHCRISQ